jgi:L-amino acid N-acyltransferase YncA
MTLEVVAADPSHVAAIQGIYAHWVTTGLASFEETPPDPAEMDRRRHEVQAIGLPYLVGLDGARVLGFAYLGPYRTRPAYRHTVEDSVMPPRMPVGRASAGRSSAG